MNMFASLISLVSLSNVSAAIAQPASFETACRTQSSCGRSADDIKKLQALFNQGDYPENLEPGAYAGRCFVNPRFAIGVRERQALPTASMLAVVDLGRDNAEGPLFKNENKQLGVEIFTPKDTDARADLFDDGMQVKNISADFTKFPAGCKQGSALVFLISTQQFEETHLKQSGNYIIAEFIMTADAPNGKFKKDDIFQTCYYFKKLN